MKNEKRLLIGAVGLVVSASIHAGPIPLTGAGYTQNFDTLYNVSEGTLGGGSVPNNAELTTAFFGVAGSGWWNGSGQTYGSATAGALVNSQRMISLGSAGSTERSITIGRQGTGTLGFGAQFQNNTGSNITQLAISYKGEQWYRGNGADLMSFEYSLNATTLLDAGATWTAWTGLNFTAPNNLAVWATGNGNLPANSATISDTITGLSIANGSTFFIRFTRNNDDGLAVDDFSIMPNASGGGGDTSGPPVFAASPTIKPNAAEGEAYSQSLAGDVSEVDGDVVTFTKLTGPGWLNVATNGALSGTPGASNVGLNVFTVEASDVDGASTGTVHVTVDAEPPPPPPGGIVNVDVNWNIEHSVNGVSDFGRDRHITVHSALTDPDWDGQEDKLDYLMNDLDVYFGRDNGSATWKFSTMEEDPDRANFVDLTYLTNWLGWWDTQYDSNINRLQYESRATEMIMGHNAHPVYPTLCWWPSGYTWTGWQPLTIEASAEFVVNYLDRGFRRGGDTSGEQLPKYWEVINEPDMLLMTGSFMVSSWEALFDYHNLVATGVKERLGADAPLIGGMTWGEHDLQVADAVSRYSAQFYYDLIVGGDPTATNGANFYKDAGTTAWPGGGSNWDQWDKIWQGFVDNCGSNMDFYSVHLYDWPGRGLGGTPRLRTGGHTEGLLDIMEWYDVHKFGEANRKPIVVSEFGSVAGWQTASQNGPHIDWENLRPFNSMMMQFLERPDYIVKSIPFTPIKATWGDWSPTQRYSSKLLDETVYGNGDWQWTGFLLWYELWADVDGTRIETKASDPDIQVDAYVDGDHAFLILNNQETTSALVNLHEFGLAEGVDSVRIKHLYCENYDDYAGTTAYPVLDDYTLQTAPGSVLLDPEATMIIRYNFAGSFTPAATLAESKVYGEKLAPAGQLNPRGGELFRKTGDTFTGNINGVVVPTGPAEAVLRISGSFVEGTLTSPRAGLDYIRINGHDLPYLTDWRGQEDGTAGGWGQLYTLEVPVPVGYLQANNVVSGQFNNTANRYAAISLQIFDFSAQPGRYGVTANVPVTGVSITETSISLPEQRQGSLTAVVFPSNATAKAINWSSSNTAVASVDPYTGRITAVAAGSATITATTVDGSFSDTAVVDVTAFVPWAVSGVRINPSQYFLKIGETGALTETIAPANAANKAVIWSSDNTSVATVDSSGIVTAVAEGTATVSATTSDGGFVDTSSITVMPPVAVTGVSVSPATALLPAGYTVQLSKSVSPVDAADPSVAWTSLDPSVATVDGNGLVTGVSIGTAHIVVTTVDGGFTATNETTVFDYVAGGTVYPVEAETFFNTGGVSNSGIGINWVEANDWAEYLVNIPADGIYQLEYVIASPNDGSGVEFRIDGVSLAKDVVPNTGGWESYVTLLSDSYLALTAGAHTARVVAASSPAWQWNLDKFILTRVDAGSGVVGSVMGISIMGGYAVIAVSNGPAAGTFHLLSNTNLMNSAGWQVVASNLVFDGTGHAVVSNMLGGLSQEYFRITEVGTTSPPPSGVSAIFDWSEVAVGTSWWLGYGYMETNNGVVMVSGGRSASHGGGDGVGGVGFALKAAYSEDAAPGTFDMQVGGSGVDFKVTSIDISANNSSGEFTPTVQGKLGGVVQWTITPTADQSFHTYITATSGDLSLLIDQIVWNTGVSSNPNSTFNNSIDNLSVFVP